MRFVAKLIFLLSIIFSSNALAAGAYIVDDGNITQKNNLLVENWYNKSSKGDQIFVSNPNHQLLPNAEFAIQETYSTNKSSAVNTLWPQVKYQWYNQKNIASSAVIGINYSSAGSIKSGIYGNYFYIPTTITLNKFVNVNIDIGLQKWRGSTNLSAKNIAIGGVGCEIKISQKSLLVGEVFRNAKNNNLHLSPYFSSKAISGLQIGYRYFYSNNLILDAIYGKNITSSSANWITAGVSILF